MPMIKQKLGQLIYSQYTQCLRQSCETHICTQVDDRVRIKLWKHIYYAIILCPVYDQLKAQIFEDHA
jgi:hypothetical protein